VSSKSRDKKIQQDIPNDEINGYGGNEHSSNFAWASANDSGEDALSVPANAIGVQQSVTVEEEESRVATSNDRGTKNRLSDASSEEWNIDIERTNNQT
jgi:hypothetical protein